MEYPPPPKLRRTSWSIGVLVKIVIRYLFIENRWSEQPSINAFLITDDMIQAPAWVSLRSTHPTVLRDLFSDLLFTDY